MVAKTRELAGAAKAVNAPFELTVYPGVRHGFDLPGSNYDAPSTDDAFAKKAAALTRYLAPLGTVGYTPFLVPVTGSNA